MISESASPTASSVDDPTRDYVAQAYFGRYGSTGMMLRTRRRIDWIAAQCRGPDVLDVGCSEGIVALLLAREGLCTLGIDTNAEAIEAARALLAQESEQVRSRVRLHHGDLESAGLAPGSFDTLVMSEVLEHLTAPERLLAAAIACVRDGGRVVITTPFGYHPDDDHRQEFGLAQFTDLVRAWTEIESIDVVDGYIRYVGVRSEITGPAWARLGERALIELGDDAARASQHVLHEHIERYRKNVAKLEKNADAVKRTTKAIETRVRSLENARAEVESHLATERASVAALRTQVDDARQTIETQRQRIRDLSGRISSMKALAASLERRAILAEQATGNSGTRLQALEREYAALRAEQARLQDSAAATARLKTKAADLSAKVDAMKQQLAVVSASDRHYRHATRVVRESVSFRLGQVFVQAAERPLPGLLLLPFRFVAVVWRYLRTPRAVAAAAPSGKSTPGKSTLAKVAKGAKHAPVPAATVADAPQEAACFEAFVPRGSRSPAAPVIATILDEFSEQCFAPEARLLPLSKRDWRAQIEAARPDLLLVESAWRGNGGQWKGEINRCAEKTGAALPALIAACRSQGIPTVFWNKEDPLNYDQFIAAAKLFDHVFTTDEALLPKYREALGHDRVGVLPFAAQPDIHNPATRRDEFGVAFAGSWFAEKHDARRAVLEPLLDAASGFDLQIFDRHSALGDPRYAFPEKYRQWIRPALPYPSVLTAYRRFKVFLNANSVLESPSMFSRRVFEVLACGTPVVSTPSAGMDAMLPGLVRVAHDETQAQRHVAELLGDEEQRRIEGHLGMREIFRAHTYRSRLETMLQKVGLPVPPAAHAPRVSIILCTNRPANLTNCLHNVRRQSYADIELMLVINKDGVDLDAVRAQFAELPCVTVLQVAEHESLYTCLNTAIARCSGEIWSKMDDDNVYGDHYIEDMVRAMDFSHADVVGKACYYTLLEHRNLSGLRRMGVENGYVKFVQGGTITARVATTRALRWSEELRSGGDSQFLRDVAAAGLTIYSSDRFNFVSVRRGDEGSHTWTIKDEDYLKRCEGVREGIEFSRILI